MPSDIIFLPIPYISGKNFIALVFLLGYWSLMEKKELQRERELLGAARVGGVFEL